jgi:hypothetical protein
MVFIQVKVAGSFRVKRITKPTSIKELGQVLRAIFALPPGAKLAFSSSDGQDTHPNHILLRHNFKFSF